MTALALLAAIPMLMWLGQTLLLLSVRQPPRWRIGGAGLPAPVKRGNRAVTYLAFGGALIAHPLLRGETPVTYYAAFLPGGDAPRAAGFGAAASVLYLLLLYLAWLASGNVQFEVRRSAGRLLRGLAAVPLTALLVALVEELVFRAMLLRDLLDTFSMPVAVALGAVLFAGAHYVRSVKRYWTFPGHLVLGVLLCLAFAWSGNLWLPLGLHAGGVLVLMGTRPFIRYRGPTWLVGASVFPFAGTLGVAALLLLILNVWLAYGSVS